MSNMKLNLTFHIKRNLLRKLIDSAYVKQNHVYLHIIKQYLTNFKSLKTLLSYVLTYFSHMKPQKDKYFTKIRFCKERLLLCVVK